MAGNPIAHAFAIDEAGNPVALQDHQLEGSENLQHIGPVQAAQLTKRGQDADYVDQNYGTAGKAGLGFASGLTLGLGPAAAAHMGFLDAGHLEAAEQSGAFGAGDVAGMLAPTLLSGGEAAGVRGVVGKALRVATPAGLMTEAGGAAGRLVGALLPEAGLLGKVAGGSLRMAAQGATEGALISAAHTASDDIIQNKPLAAQALLASGAHGALFGGLVGGVLGGASGLASAGIDAAGGGAARLAGGGTRDAAAARALKHAGADAGDIEMMRAREGGLPGAVSDFKNVMDEAGTGYASKTSHIHEQTKLSLGKLREVADDAVSELQQTSPMGVPKAARVGDRLEKEVMNLYANTSAHLEAEGVVNKLRDKIEGKADAVTGLRAGGIGNNWSKWTQSRDMLSEEMSKASGIPKEVYKTALNVYNDELAVAMKTANPEAAAKYAAATTQAKLAEELVDMSSRKSAKDVLGTDSKHLTPQDLSTGGFALFAGANPLVAAGIIAARKIGARVQEAMEGPIAEYSARTAMGAQAGGAVVSIGRKTSETFKSFLGGARREGIKQLAAAPKLSYSMKNYNESIRLADELTSENHMAKVRETTEALAAAGHPELAREMAETYGRAVAYINNSKPKRGTKEVQASKLGKAAKALTPDTGGGKFLRKLHAVMNPMSIVDDLMHNGASRDAVAAVKYVFPDLHQDIVSRAHTEILTMKEEGRYLAADKVSMLGTVLDAPIDSTLEKAFIGEVQQGLAANKKPAADEGSAPPPQTDTSSYQTPLQSSIG